MNQDQDLIEVQKIDGRVMTTSLAIAEKFHKRHDNVLRDIQELTDCVGALRNEATSAMFVKEKYLDKSNRESPMYYISRDGFALLAMGFTGNEALQWKLRYLEAFNKMESYILAHDVADSGKLHEWGQVRLLTKRVRRTFTDVIKEELIPAAIAQGSKNFSKMYINYTSMLNKAFVEDTGVELKKGDTVRDYLDVADLAIFSRAEERLAKKICELVEKGITYKEIYQESKEYMLRIAEYFGTVTPLAIKRGPTPSLAQAEAQQKLL